MVLVMAHCGLRIGEAIALRKGAVDLGRLELLVAESLTEVPNQNPVLGLPKYGLTRKVAIPVFLAPEFAEAIEGISSRDFVFRSARGGMVDRSRWCNRVWKPARAKAGFGQEVTPYALRHSFAAFSVAQGCSAEDVQVSMGFASLQNTRTTYSDLFPKGRSRKYCSDRCMHTANRRRGTRSCTRDGCEKPVRAKELCGTHYNSTFHKGSQRKYDDPEKKRIRDRKRTQWRRAVVTDPNADLIDRNEVGDRDGWVCWVCKRDVDRTLAWPDPLSASLEHIVPLARGGRHVLTNVSVSHLTCNVKRGCPVNF
jgi:hypothetical protein